MRRFTITAIGMALSPIFIYGSCKKDQNCKDAICTMIVASVMVNVQTSEGLPITLDEVYTVRKKTGAKINLEQGMANGRYHVLDDSYRSPISNSTESFTFIGIKDGKQIINEKYSISADCCHVKKQEGKDIIIVNQ